MATSLVSTSTATVINDIATWDELADIPDLIVGTEALTVTGRIRALDAALADVRTQGVDSEDSGRAVMAHVGAELACPTASSPGTPTRRCHTRSA